MLPNRLATSRLEPDHQGLGRRELAPGVEHRPEAAAGQQLADDERLVLLLAPVVDRHHVRAAERGRGSGLGPEALQEGGVVGQPLIDAMGVGWLMTTLGLVCWISGNLTIWLLRRNSRKWRVQMDRALGDE